MTDNRKLEAEKLVKIIVDSLQEKKAKDVVSMNMKNIPNAITDYFIVCHGTSTTQVEAIADAAIERMRDEAGEKPWHTEGRENAEWILIDYVNVVLHEFQESVRKFYQLGELWADADLETYDDEQD
ncbi:MAG: ribosome silencing factor [Bacteroidales bacterium]|nr:ribosome silencing factor [Bacteroidales bacterium]